MTVNVFIPTSTSYNTIHLIRSVFFCSWWTSVGIHRRLFQLKNLLLSSYHQWSSTPLIFPPVMDLFNQLPVFQCQFVLHVQDHRILSHPTDIDYCSITYKGLSIFSFKSYDNGFSLLFTNYPTYTINGTKL